MHYHWQSPESFLTDIEIYAPHKEQEAMIYAPAEADPKKLQELADKIKILGYVAEPDMEGEHYVLRVKKFHEPAELLTALEKDGYIQGSHTTQKTNFDNSEAHKLKPQQMTGLLYMIGDIVMIGSGAMRNGWLNGKGFFKTISEGPGAKDITSSAKWLLSGALLFFLGQKDPDKQAQYAYHDLAESMKKAGFDLSPEDETSLKALAEHKDGLLPKLERLVREQPLVINSILQAAGGWDNAMAGVAQKRPDGSINTYKTLGGTSTFLGHTTGLLTDETPKHVKEAKQKQKEDGTQEPDHRSLLEKFNDWRHEKKYRIAGSGSVIASLFRLVSGYQEVKINKHFLEGDGDFTFKGEGNKLVAEVRKHVDAKELPENITKIFDDLRKPKNEREEKIFHKLTDEHNKLADTFTRVNNAKYAAKIEWGVNVVKTVANWYYALAGASINADIKKLGVLDEICNSVAHMAHKEHDPELRTLLVGSSAAMLAEQQGIDNSETEILEGINKKLAALESNPWLKPMQPRQEQQKEALPETSAMTPAPKVHDVSGHIPPQPLPEVSSHI